MVISARSPRQHAAGSMCRRGQTRSENDLFDLTSRGASLPGGAPGQPPRQSAPGCPASQRAAPRGYAAGRALRELSVRPARCRSSGRRCRRPGDRGGRLTAHTGADTTHAAALPDPRTSRSAAGSAAAVRARARQDRSRATADASRDLRAGRPPGRVLEFARSNALQPVFQSRSCRAAISGVRIRGSQRDTATMRFTRPGCASRVCKLFPHSAHHKHTS